MSRQESKCFFFNFPVACSLNAGLFQVHSHLVKQMKSMTVKVQVLLANEQPFLKQVSNILTLSYFCSWCCLGDSFWIQDCISFTGSILQCSVFDLLDEKIFLIFWSSPILSPDYTRRPVQVQHVNQLLLLGFQFLYLCFQLCIQRFQFFRLLKTRFSRVRIFYMA